MQYLFLVTIGPVQDFIAASRKTRDLWFGSMLLGKVSRAAAVALENHIDKARGDALIFPFPGGARAARQGNACPQQTARNRHHGRSGRVGRQGS